MSEKPGLPADGGPSPEDALSGGGEVGALMRSLDWSKTVFGPAGAWPQSLRTAVSMILDSQFAMVVAWGPEFRFFYNDRYRPVLGRTKHPSALVLIALDRNGYLETVTSRCPTARSGTNVVITAHGLIVIRRSLDLSRLDGSRYVQ